MPGSKKVESEVVAARTDRKDRADRNIVFKVGRPVKRIDRDTERCPGIEDFRQLRLLGQNGCNRCCAQRAAHHLVGGDIDILLQIAIGIDAAMSSGDAGQWSIGNEVGKVDRCRRKRLDHGGDRGPVRRVLRRAIEMRTQGHAFVHGRSPVSALCGRAPMRRAGRQSAAHTSQFAKLGKFSYLWPWQSFPYKGGADGKPVSAGNDYSPASRAGSRSQRSIGDRSRQTAASDSAGRHAADSQFAGAGRPAPDSAHRRRNASDRCRA